jgi:hypothetical protein
MILAASSAHATASINTDYYVTIAAVIPTLFIAIAVQGGVSETLATAARDKASPLIRPAVGALTTTRGWPLARPLLRILGVAYAAIFLTVAALGILIAGWIGEGAALWAVVAKQDNPVLLITTLTATGILVIAATAQPFQKLFGAYADVARTITNAVRSANPAAAQDGRPREPAH